MTRETYLLLENYMLSCMQDTTHDREHIYRVLYQALEIAGQEKEVDYDVLIAACLLHDIGRQEQFADPRLCHARVGAEKAYAFLTEHGFDETYARRVSECILTHRFRRENQPGSMEARILFDADKIDVAGAIGIARTLTYVGDMSRPLYSVGEDGQVSDGEGDTQPSFFHEYKYKLERLYDSFLTQKGAQIAGERRKAAVDFYNSIFREVSESSKRGRELLRAHVGE